MVPNPADIMAYASPTPRREEVVPVAVGSVLRCGSAARSVLIHTEKLSTGNVAWENSRWSTVTSLRKSR